MITMKDIKSLIKYIGWQYLLACILLYIVSLLVFQHTAAGLDPSLHLSLFILWLLLCVVIRFIFTNLLNKKEKHKDDNND